MLGDLSLAEWCLSTYTCEDGKKKISERCVNLARIFLVQFGEIVYVRSCRMAAKQGDTHHPGHRRHGRLYRRYLQDYRPRCHRFLDRNYRLHLLFHHADLYINHRRPLLLHLPLLLLLLLTLHILPPRFFISISRLRFCKCIFKRLIRLARHQPLFIHAVVFPKVNNAFIAC